MKKRKEYSKKLIISLIMMMFFANISQVKASTLHLEAALSQDGQLINTPQAITVSIHKDSPASTEVWTNDFSEVPFDQGQFTLDLGSIQKNDCVIFLCASILLIVFRRFQKFHLSTTIKWLEIY